MNPNINTIPDTANTLPSTSLKERIKSIWDNIPLFVRFICIVTLIFFLINLFWNGISFYLANVPYYSLWNFQLWRLITSVMITTGVFNVIFSFLAWIADAARLEQQSGTMRYMFNFLINSTLIQVLYSLLILTLVPFFGTNILLTVNVDSEKVVHNNGLWPVIMAEITLLCLVNPENPVMLFYIPYQFRAKFYPFVLLAFFTLLNGIQLDLFAGLAYGYLFFYFLRSKISFSDRFIIKCENFILLKCLKNIPSFITIQQAGLYNNVSISYNPHLNSGSQSPPPRLDRFPGKGIVVGKCEAETPKANESTEKLDISEEKRVAADANKPTQQYHELKEEQV